MKKFTKLMLATVAVTAVSTVMAVSAMAANPPITCSEPVDGVVTLTGVDKTLLGDQETLLVLRVDADDITEAMIAQIDQSEEIPSFKLSADDVKAVTDGATYYVRMGGSNGEIQTGILKISSGGETVTIKIGDANLDGYIRMNDASAIAAKSVGTSNAQNVNVGIEKTVVSSEVESLTEGKVVKIGDANLDGYIRMNDASAIAAKSVGTSNAQNVNVGKTVEVVE